MRIKGSEMNSTPDTQPPSDTERLRVVFKKICSFCARYDKTTRAINSSSEGARLAANLLQRFGIYLMRSLPEAADSRLVMSFSKAKPSMPRVPWVGLTPAGKFVSSSLSVTVCFGRHGDGAVAGVMQPSTVKVSGVQPVNRTTRNSLVIDVDGNNPSTKYNDRFINPREFLVSEIDGADLLKHISDSIVLLRSLS